MKIEFEVVIQIVSAVVTILSLFAAIYFYLRGRKIKMLSYFIMDNFEIVQVAEKLKDRIEIFVDGKKATKCYLKAIKFINNGNEPIQVSDFNKPIKLYFGEEAEIYEYTITGIKPDNLEVEITNHINSLEIMPLLLNPLDSFSLRVLVNSTDELNVTGRIAGVPEIKDITRRVEDIVPQFEFSFGNGLKASIGFEGAKRIYRIKKY